MGANRLASNSLIECLVFASRAVEDSEIVGAVKEFPKFGKTYTKNSENSDLYTEIRTKVAEIMNTYAGIIRSEETLTEGLNQIAELEKQIDAPSGEYYAEAARRLITVARLIMEPALMRKESRGGHYRDDFPHADEAFVLHSVQKKGERITTAPVNSGYYNF
jgi:L-aspartate oxidase